MIRPSFDLRATQHLTLTPRLQQSVKLLQLSALELAHELQHALANNPFLEEDEALAAANQEGIQASSDADVLVGVESGPVTTLAVSEAGAAERESADSFAADSEGEFAEHHAFDEADQSAGSLNDYPRPGRRDDGDDDYNTAGDSQAVQFSLHQHLHRALRHYHLGERDRLLVELVVEALDDDGYLREDLAALAGTLPIEPQPDDTELSMALKLVQQLDVPGIGARSLAECLHLQLQAQAASAARDHDDAHAQRVHLLAARVIDAHLSQLARREYAEVERVLGCTAADLRSAFQLIRGLDPKPGLRYGNTRVVYVTPDVIVRKLKGVWRVTTNPAVLPRARLNQSYASMFRHAQCKDRAPLAQELQEARWLIRNVEQRFSTIQRVAEAIVAHQRNFFEYGEAALKPYGLRECAEALGLHESTISRATGNKYMATPRGIFEFKHFFSRELATESGGTCSAAAVRALLKGMIEAEDNQTPLSDVELTRMLANRGVVVARRTVTKYRGQLHLPPAELRRQI